ncbi:echinoderm microtubule-associated protein-like 2 isoform X4 [Anolis carolinensis]|uniref:echinoderm microtubule-associated protein-like 2 isoform X4 n=1 Tax=Anolis carolinensis TaxID=28377 RepID=UPI0007DB84E6|nr:PREDICTED: echinoderm microtubule-associated protein-like 2 isoform X2 [Anolis carolinensis]|eukprot:XP_016854011.1 PREDICTED: echinoderm microtubule-associated protein-like 2 isoform X2 [Anolis carolinensis]
MKKGPKAEVLLGSSSERMQERDDNLSGVSGMEVDDRISYLEQRLQLQEDEIQVLKAALADVLRRLSTCEENGLSLQKKGPNKVYQLLRGLPSRPSLSNGIIPQRRGYSTSPSSPKRELLSGKRILRGEAPRAFSGREHLSGRSSCPSPEGPPAPLQRPSGKDQRSRTTSSSSSCSVKREGKPKEATFNAEDGYVKMFLRGRPIPMFVPDAVVATFSLDAKLDLPHKKLKLDWVYGYRGRDCRANLFLLPTGEIAYFVAAVAVLYNVEEQRQRHYLGHTDDIKCLAVHPDMVTIATGQVAGTSKDGKPLPPHVRVWDSVSLNTLHVLGPGPFDRAVSCVGFSKSNGGGLLCAVDDSNDHVLSVWDWQKEQKLADVKCSNESVLAATFHPTEPTLLITCGKSHIHFWTLEGGSLSKRQGIFEKHEKPKYVLCIAFTENGDTVTGDSGGNLYIWGKGGNRICHAVPGAHEGGIFGLCVLRNGTIVTGGGRDRRVVLWGRDYHKLQENEVPEGFGPVRTVAEGKGDSLFVGTTRNSVLHGSLATGFSLLVQGHTEELWGLATHPTLDQFLTCGQDKQVHLWSVATHQPLWSKGIDDAARSAGFHPSGSVLVVGTVTGRWLVLDTETRDLVTIHTDGGEQISVVSFSPDGKYLALGSHDNFVYIYLVSEGGRKYSRVGKCSGHSSFITHLDWAYDSSCLVTNSGDYEILYWDPSTCRQITSAEAVRNMEWATATCVLGFGVFGIWPEGADGTDINAVCRSHDGKLLASADDFGKVHLFSYPCCQPRAPSYTYNGHSSHVTNIAFLHDDSLLLSTGGTDTSILQWRLG